MIRIERSAVAVPASLAEGRESAGSTELKKVEAHMAAEAKARADDPTHERKTFAFAAYKASDVKTALEQLFRGKCAYCEGFYSSSHPIDVEHYRPKSEVEGVPDHDGYWWLAMDWENLLPSCIDCNRRRFQTTPTRTDAIFGADGFGISGAKTIKSGKAAAFPLADEKTRAWRRGPDLKTEDRLLLDPTRDEPADHLVFHADPLHPVSLVLAKTTGKGDGRLYAEVAAGDLVERARIEGFSAKGAVSINVYGLNRLGLVQARTKVLRNLQFLVLMLERIEEVVSLVDERIARRGKVGRFARGATAEDEVLFATVSSRLKQLRDAIRADVRRQVAPDAPYSAAARAWVSAFIGEDASNGPTSNGSSPRSRPVR